MPRRSKYDFEAMRASMNIECPNCSAILTPAEQIRVDSKRVRLWEVRDGLYSAAERRDPPISDELKRQSRAILLRLRFHSRVA
jgi:hypothetical protein